MIYYLNNQIKIYIFLILNVFKLTLIIIYYFEKMQSKFLGKTIKSIYYSNIRYNTILNKVSFNRISHFGFLNILKKSNNQDSELERYSKLKSKYNKDKKEEEGEENIEKLKERAQDESFIKFLQFLENKETFTWQNNLELMKVNIL
jgi:hypothetical protein